MTARKDSTARNHGTKRNDGTTRHKSTKRQASMRGTTSTQPHTRSTYTHTSRGITENQLCIDCYLIKHQPNVRFTNALGICATETCLPYIPFSGVVISVIQRTVKVYWPGFWWPVISRTIRYGSKSIRSHTSECRPDDMHAKQKPQAAWWRFVARSRDHKASWQNRKNRQLFGRIVAGSTSAKTCPAVNLSRAQRKKKRGGSVY